MGLIHLICQQIFAVACPPNVASMLDPIYLTSSISDRFMKQNQCYMISLYHIHHFTTNGTQHLPLKETTTTPIGLQILPKYLERFLDLFVSSRIYDTILLKIRKRILISTFLLVDANVSYFFNQLLRLGFLACCPILVGSLGGSKSHSRIKTEMEENNFFHLCFSFYSLQSNSLKESKFSF